MTAARTNTAGQQRPVLILIGTYVRIIPGKGARLKVRRLERGLTQAQLGYLCNKTSQATISLLENEKMQTCTQELAQLICKHLDLMIDDYFKICGDTPDPKMANVQVVIRRRPGRRGGRRPKSRDTQKKEAA